MTKEKSMYMKPSFMCYQVNVEEGILLTSFEGDHDIIGNDNRNLERDHSDEPDFNL